MAANNLMQTAQSLIRGTVRGILAQRQVTVRVAVTWASHADACARVLAVSAEHTRFWFHHSVRVTLYAVHRARQRVLLGTLLACAASPQGSCGIQKCWNWRCALRSPTRPQLPGPTLATSSWPTRSSAHGLLR